MRRIGGLATLKAETQAWAQAANGHQRYVLWQFNIHDVRLKLNSLSTLIPKILI